MINFECDYLEGAHPRILERMITCNMEQSVGYGCDEHCDRARALLAEETGVPADRIHLLVGGTQTNKTVISSILRPWQGVLCAATGHINVHESGAIESTGHKVLGIESSDGKLTAAMLEKWLKDFYADSTYSHMVQPGMVYISESTELGGLYTKDELAALKEVCAAYSIPLFIDGARLGYALAALEGNLTLKELKDVCDVYYIGGTKVGALLGEAVVIVNPAYNDCFRTMMKQNGALLAKGRLLGIQYETLFEDGLYLQISKHAVDCALKVRAVLEEKHIPVLLPSDTNQQFPIFDNATLKKLSEKYIFSPWGNVDENHSAVRICTSWATTEENLDMLLKDLRSL